MKRLVFLFLCFPFIATAQLDLESNNPRLNMVRVPAIESPMLTPMPNKISFLNKFSNKLPSFRLSKENYREPVSMSEAMSTSENYAESDIQMSLNAKFYGISAGNSIYPADGSSKVRNIVYKDVSRGFLYPDLYTRNGWGFGVYPTYSPYRVGRSYY